MIKETSKLYLSLIIILNFIPYIQFAQNSEANFSTAGFFELENSGRKAYNFNVDWRFLKETVIEFVCRDGLSTEIPLTK